MHFWQECHRNDDVPSVHNITGFMVQVCLIAGDFDHDHLVKVVSAGFLHPSVASERGWIGKIFLQIHSQ